MSKKFKLNFLAQEDFNETEVQAVKNSTNTNKKVKIRMELLQPLERQQPGTFELGISTI